MVNVSPYSISRKLRKEIYEQLLEVLVGGRYKQASRQALSDLLSDAELIQLAKRLAVIILIKKEVPAYRIQRMLAVSPATVFRHAKKLESGKYKSIESFVDRKQKNKELLETLDLLLRAGMPHYASKRRWQWLGDVFKD